MADQIEKHTINNPDEISLKEVVFKIQRCWRFLLSKWVVIVCAGIIGGLIGLAYAWSKKPLYKAELSFALQDDKSSELSGAIGLTSQFGIDLGGGHSGGEFSGDNLLALMKSRYIVEKALLTTINLHGKTETLADFYIDFNDYRKSWKDNPQLAKMYFLPNADRSKFNLAQDSVLGLFYKALATNNLVVDKLDKKLSIISLSVKSTNELFSKYFTEVLAKVVSDFYIQTKIEKQKENVAILQRRTDSVRRILYGGISSVAASTDVNPNPNPSLQILNVPSQRKQVEVQTNGAILNELVKNLESAKMSLLQETPLISPIDTPILPLEKERVSKLNSIIMGGALGAFLTAFILIFRRFFQIVLK